MKIAIGLILAGCALPVSLEQQGRALSDNVVCMNASDNPRRDVQEHARNELLRRNVTCTPEMIQAARYARQQRLQEQASRQQQNDQALQNAATLLARPPAPTIPIQPEVRCQSYTAGGQTYTACR